MIKNTIVFFLFILIQANLAHSRELVLYYDMNEQPDPESIILDSSGNEHHATWSRYPAGSEPAGVRRDDGRAYLDLSGEDTRFLFGPKIEMDGRDFLVEVVFRLPQDYPSDVNAAYPHVLFGNNESCSEDWNTGGFSLHLNYETGKGWTLAACIVDNSESGKTDVIKDFYDDEILDYDRWYRASLLYSKNFFELYLDGKLQNRLKLKTDFSSYNQLPVAIGSLSPKLPFSSAFIKNCNTRKACLEVPPVRRRKPFLGHIASIALWTNLDGEAAKEDFYLYTDKDDFAEFSDRAMTNSRMTTLLSEGFDYPPSRSDDGNFYYADLNQNHVFALSHIDWKPQSGLRGAALGFDRNSRLESQSIETKAAFTLSFWIKPHALDDDRNILSLLSSNHQNSELFYLSLDDADGHVILKNENQILQPFEFVSAEALALNRWNHIAITYNYSSLKFFINGLEQGSTRIGLSDALIEDIKLVFGNNQRRDSVKAFLDDIHFLRQSYGREGIQSLYKLRVDSKEHSYFSFGPDYSSQSNSGTSAIHQKSLYVRYLDNGVFGKAANFDTPLTKGLVIRFPESNRNDFLDEFSLSFLFYPEERLDEKQTLFRGVASSGFYSRVYLDDHQKLHVEVKSSHGLRFHYISQENIPLHQWTSLAVIFDNRFLKVYLNEDLVSGTVSEGPIHMKVDRVDMGIHYVGRIDEVYLMDRALSQEEVLSHFSKLKVSEVTAISDYRNYPQKAVWNRQLIRQNGLSLSLAPGEVEALSFVVESSRNHDGFHDFMVRVSDLRNQASIIESSQVDLKYVQVWYQGRNDLDTFYHLDIGFDCIHGRGDVIEDCDLEDSFQEVEALRPQELKPELLLNDPRLVIVDQNSEENFIRDHRTQNYVLKPDQVQDSDHFLSTNLEPGINQQYWLELSLPENTMSGTYTGFLTLSSRGIDIQRIPLKVKVYDFELEDPHEQNGLFYLSELEGFCEGHGDCRTEDQYMAELENLKDHGVNYISLYKKYISPREEDASEEDENIDDVVSNLDDILHEMSLRQDAGLSGDKVMYVGMTGNFYEVFADDHPCASFNYNEKSIQLIDAFKQNGFPEIYFYLPDEAKKGEWPKNLSAGLRLKDLSSYSGYDLKFSMGGDTFYYSLLDEINGKPEIESYISAFHENCPFEIVGDYLGENTPEDETFFLNEAIIDRYLLSENRSPASIVDWPVINFGNKEREKAIPELLSSIHEDGNELWAYSHPQGGVERAFLYRYKMGLWLWAHGLDGTHTWAYQDGRANPWVDKDTVRNRLNEDCRDSYESEALCEADQTNPHLFETCRQKGDTWRNCRSVPILYKDQMMTYPTVDGVVDTLQWKGYREGVDDLRYLSTYLKLLHELDQGNRDLPEDDLNYLNALRNYILQDNIDEAGFIEIRRSLVERINYLRNFIR